MDLVDPHAVRDGLLDSRRQHQDAIVALDARIQVVDDYIALLENGGVQTPAPAGSAVSAAPGPGTQSSRRKSVDHPAVKALRFADLRPYRRCTTLRELALAYARRHNGEVLMAELVPLAVRLGLSQAVLYKNAWGGIFKTVSKQRGFSECKGGTIKVDPDRLRPGAAPAA